MQEACVRYSSRASACVSPHLTSTCDVVMRAVRSSITRWSAQSRLRFATASPLSTNKVRCILRPSVPLSCTARLFPSAAAAAMRAPTTPPSSCAARARTAGLRLASVRSPSIRCSRPARSCATLVNGNRRRPCRCRTRRRRCRRPRRRPQSKKKAMSSASS